MCYVFNRKSFLSRGIVIVAVKSLLGNAKVALTILFPVSRFNLQHLDFKIAGLRAENVFPTFRPQLSAVRAPPISHGGFTNSCNIVKLCTYVCTK
jgi:hypothetical protein